MTVNGSLAYPHCRSNTGEWHTIGKTQFNDAPCLRRNVITYQTVNSCYCFIIRTFLNVVFLIVKEISVGYALMNLTVTDMVQAAVPDRFQQIAPVDMETWVSVKQRGKHIMDDVARKIIVMQKCRGQPVHLRIMCFEKLFYVVPVRHIYTNKTHNIHKTQPFKDKILEKIS